MIYRDCTINVKNDVSELNEDIILYRGDREVEIYFSIVESPYLYSKIMNKNIIEKTNASYAQMIIKVPNDKPPIIGDITETNEGKVVLKITGEMIDEIEENGDYDFQIRLYDDTKVSRVTIPPVLKKLHIKEPIAIEDNSTSNLVGIAKVGYTRVGAEGVQRPTLNEDQTYNKKTWIDNEPITKEDLNVLEDIADKNTTNIKKLTAANNNTHTHDNKATLDKITEEKITTWDSKAEGSHNHDTVYAKKTEIPVVDVTKEYVDTELALKSDVHEHPYLSDKTVIPSKTSQLQNDSNYATENFVTTKIEEAQLSGGGSTGGGNVDLSNYYNKSQSDAKFVEKVSGKQLSTNDYTTLEKNKLSTIENITTLQIDESVEGIIPITPSTKPNNFYTKTECDSKFALKGENSGSIPTLPSSSSIAWYNAKNYNVKGDNSTDDSEALNSLIRRVHDNGGGVIYCPKGKYVLKNQMNWLSGVSLFGDGVGNTIFRTVRNGTTYDVSHAAIGYDSRGDYGIAGKKPFENCHFRDFEIDGSGIVSTDNHYCVRIKGIYMQYLINCTFKNLYIHDTIATGLGVDFLDKSHIDNVVVKNCGRGFETMTGGSLGGAGIGIGTGAMQSENLIISNCQAIGCGHFGIFLEHQKLFEGNLDAEAKGVIISDCITKNGRYYGIGVRGGVNVTIDSCESYNNTKHGIYCYTLDTSYLIVNNCQIYDNKEHGISIYDMKVNGIKISNNIFSNNTHSDFHTKSLRPNCEDFVINDNVFKGSLVGINFDCPNNVTGVVMSNNTFAKCRELGISIQDGNQYAINGLFIKNNVFRDIGTSDREGKAICLWLTYNGGTVTNNSFWIGPTGVNMKGIHYLNSICKNVITKDNYYSNVSQKIINNGTSFDGGCITEGIQVYNKGGFLNE